MGDDDLVLYISRMLRLFTCERIMNNGILFGISAAIFPWWFTAILAVPKLNELVDDLHDEIFKNNLETYDS